VIRRPSRAPAGGRPGGSARLDRRTVVRFGLAAMVAGLAGFAVTPRARAQLLGGFNFSGSSAPIEIEADEGIEWRRDEKVYVARGNAHVARGDLSVDADRISAHYRDTPTGGTDIYRITAEGNVKLTSSSDIIVGDVATYDLDQGSFIVTGQNLRVETKGRVLTARDSLEYWEKQQALVARGNAEVTEGNRKVRADLLTGYLRKNADGRAELYQVEAAGNVRIRRGEEYASAAQAVYNLDSDIATLSGSVKITRGENQLNGDYAEFNMRTGVSRILSKPGSGARVHTLIVPNQPPSATAP
jgi:lipopolysaccharide export system protein LptA